MGVSRQHSLRPDATTPQLCMFSCVKEPQLRATVLSELDSGYTSSNGGGQAYPHKQTNAGLATRVQ